MNDRMRTAWHESGHAVVACALGVPLRTAVILDADGSCGKTYLKSSDADAATLALIYLAGPIAARRADPAGPGDLGAADRIYASELLREAGDDADTLAAVVAMAEREAARLVDRLWPAISQAAAVLMRDGYVTDDDIRTLMKEERSHVLDLHQPANDDRP